MRKGSCSHGYSDADPLRGRHDRILCGGGRYDLSGPSWRGLDQQDIVHQVRATFESMRRTLESVGASLDDLVQVNFYIKNTADFRKGADVFREYFPHGVPARMTVVTDFIGENCLCQMDGIAYHPRAGA